MAPPLGSASSSSGAGVFTPSSSSNSHASAAGSNNSNASSGQSRKPSYLMASYVAQPATEDGSPYGRLVGQPRGEADRVEFYTARAQQTVDKLGRRISKAR
ncbi:predicted protein [Chaetomium globosum CBS 148.51]|uniref:Uncharacterized protein n=1 Tax=Chaetomium globosum (strain ATCC 6205 / CBS 148.51 / DSM 1962 / NBRC 6347 / NRRL 1970) TaxID=306901 RepID=Q2GNH9_CHAGB|nr:uncharacterized protein CHGG_10475 [Chaetomium globosum CBS 148.51]EAQ84071.1 predicted protein [Chaetomium globosum CBS 148.51]